MKKVGLFVLRSGVAVFCIFSMIIVIISINFYFHMEKYPPDPKQGYYSAYYLYSPHSVVKQANRGEQINLLVMPNNTGKTSDDILFHERFALFQLFIGHLIFGNLDVAILVPAFPRTSQDWKIYTHALDRDVFEVSTLELRRLDLQLRNMVDDTRGRFQQRGWNINSRFLMFGFSASGMFVNRFTLLHPEQVLAASIGSPGGWPLAPIEVWNGHSLRYPIGVSDLPSLAGNEINYEAFKKVPQLFWLGAEDRNDSVPYRDGYEQEDANLIFALFGQSPVERWPIIQGIYEGISENTIFKLYPRLNHRPSIQAIKDTNLLFREALRSVQL